MKKSAINLSRKSLESYLDGRLSLRLMNIREMMDRGVSPETYLNGPDADTLRDIWDDVLKMAAREALASTGHQPLPAYTDDTVELLTRDSIGTVEGSRPFMYTDVRLANGLYRIYKDSFEFGDGAVRLLEPAGRESLVPGLEEDELAGFLLAFDALVPHVRKKLEGWGPEVAEAARRKEASRKADQVAETTVERLLEKHVHPLGIDWECTVSGGMVGLALYGPQNEGFFEIPFGEFPAFLRDREALSSVLRGIGGRA